MASGGMAGYLNQAVPLSLLSPVLPFFFLTTQRVPLLFLSHLSTTYLHIVVAPAAGGPLGIFLLSVIFKEIKL